MKTRFNPVILVLSLALMMVLSNACKKDEGSNTYGNDEIQIAENVLILNEAQGGQLIAVNNNELTFSGGDSELNGIEEGDIVVSDIIEGLAPRGFLRRVLTITESGGQIILTTENAELTDAIESCSVRFARDLTEDDIIGKSSGFDFELSMGDNSPISGELNFAPRLLFDLDIGVFRVDYAKLGLGTNYSMSVILETQPNFEYELSKELFEKDLRPITFLIGGIFPLVITPDFEIEAGFEYRGGLQFYTSYGVSGSTDFYVEKDANGWEAHKDTNESASSTGISGRLSSEFEFYFRPAIEFEFYDIDNVETSFYAKKSVTGEMSYDNESGFSCELSCGVALGGEVEVEILGFELNPSVEAQIADFEPFYECPENGLSTGVNDLIPDSLITVLEDLDMPINEGFDPPNIEGSYFMNNMTLVSSNIAGDEIGHQFIDLSLRFSNQNPANLTVGVNYDIDIGGGAGTGSFIVGTGNDFTVFVELEEIRNDGNRAKTALVYSGEITPSGIRNFHCAHMMLDDYGDPGDVFIEIGQARIVNDADGFSPRQ